MFEKCLLTMTWIITYGRIFFPYLPPSSSWSGKIVMEYKKRHSLAEYYMEDAMKDWVFDIMKVSLTSTYRVHIPWTYTFLVSILSTILSTCESLEGSELCEYSEIIFNLCHNLPLFHLNHRVCLWRVQFLGTRKSFLQQKGKWQQKSKRENPSY